MEEKDSHPMSDLIGNLCICTETFIGKSKGRVETNRNHNILDQVGNFEVIKLPVLWNPLSV